MGDLAGHDDGRHGARRRATTPSSTTARSAGRSTRVQLPGGPQHHAPALDHRRGAELAGHDHYLGTSKGHSYAGSISGRRGSFHHNLLVHNAGRNWSLAGGYDQAGRYDGFLDIRNNVVYNWDNRTNDGGVKLLNLVNNYYKPGPATTMFDLLKFDGGRPEDPQYYYVSGNVVEGRSSAPTTRARASS